MVKWASAVWSSGPRWVSVMASRASCSATASAFASWPGSVLRGGAARRNPQRSRCTPTHTATGQSATDVSGRAAALLRS